MGSAISPTIQQRQFAAAATWLTLGDAVLTVNHHWRPKSQLRDLLRQTVHLGVAQHASREAGVAPVTVIDRTQPDTQPLRPAYDGPPGVGIGQRVALEGEARAGEEQAALIGEMRTVVWRWTPARSATKLTVVRAAPTLP